MWLYGVCDGPAVWFCPANDVFLCGECDKEIHEANFVVRNHQRMMVFLRDSLSQSSDQSKGDLDKIREDYSGSQGIGGSVTPEDSPHPASARSLRELIEERDRWRATNVPPMGSDKLQGMVGEAEIRVTPDQLVTLVGEPLCQK